MLRAVEACKEGMSVRQAVRLYKVPRSTLADRVNGRVTHGAVSRPGQLLSKSDELSLVRYCQYMASHGHPLTKNQCIAFGTSIRPITSKVPGRLCWRNGHHHRLPRSHIRISCHHPPPPPPPPAQYLHPLCPPAPRIHPLVASGDISADLAEILMECNYKKKTTRRLPVAARVITGEEFQRLFREREEKEQVAAALKEQWALLRRKKMEQLAQRQRAAVAAASSSTAAGPRTTSGTVARPPLSRGTPAAPSRRRGPAAPLRTSTSPDQCEHSNRTRVRTKSGPNKQTETLLKRWSRYASKRTLVRFVCDVSDAPSTESRDNEECTRGGRLPIPRAKAQKRNAKSCRADDEFRAYMTDNRRMLEEIRGAEQGQVAQEAATFEWILQAQQEAEERRFRAMQAQQQATNQMFL
ncbi:hypothetical protein SKAU_G00210700 [Synaphobranchus kaupii]|uniref:HTH psq-type domain-containing protein n=1 Tax=Synaphobranchus kaupii TaxID=118154 RepID=A0A9Q1F9A1_SYNKA|nr:hypothetical protein SKAU_G00210700 [Synaphobranchus kaupii]